MPYKKPHIILHGKEADHMLPFAQSKLRRMRQEGTQNQWYQYKDWRVFIKRGPDRRIPDRIEIWWRERGPKFVMAFRSYYDPTWFWQGFHVYDPVDHAFDFLVGITDWPFVNQFYPFPHNASIKRDAEPSKYIRKYGERFRMGNINNYEEDRRIYSYMWHRPPPDKDKVDLQSDIDSNLLGYYVDADNVANPAVPGETLIREWFIDSAHEHNNTHYTFYEGDDKERLIEHKFRTAIKWDDTASDPLPPNPNYPDHYEHAIGAIWPAPNRPTFWLPVFRDFYASRGLNPEDSSDWTVEYVLPKSIEGPASTWDHIYFDEPVIDIDSQTGEFKYYEPPHTPPPPNGSPILLPDGDAYEFGSGMDQCRFKKSVAPYPPNQPGFEKHEVVPTPGNPPVNLTYSYDSPNQVTFLSSWSGQPPYRYDYSGKDLSPELAFTERATRIQHTELGILTFVENWTWLSYTPGTWGKCFDPYCGKYHDGEWKHWATAGLNKYVMTDKVYWYDYRTKTRTLKKQWTASTGQPRKLGWAGFLEDKTGKLCGYLDDGLYYWNPQANQFLDGQNPWGANGLATDYYGPRAGVPGDSRKIYFYAAPLADVYNNNGNLVYRGGFNEVQYKFTIDPALWFEMFDVMWAKARVWVIEHDLVNEDGIYEDNSTYGILLNARGEKGDYRTPYRNLQYAFVVLRWTKKLGFELVHNYSDWGKYLQEAEGQFLWHIRIPYLNRENIVMDGKWVIVGKSGYKGGSTSHDGISFDATQPVVEQDEEGENGKKKGENSSVKRFSDAKDSIGSRTYYVIDVLERN